MKITKRIAKSMLLGVSAAMLLATPALAAKMGPDDWYDTYESKSRYRVGDDVDDGLLYFFNKSDTKDASITIKRDGEVIWSAAFWNNYIVKVEDGDIINSVNAYCIDDDEVEPWSVVSSEEGFYKVGTDIAEGTYDVEYIRGEDEEGYVRVWTDDLFYADKEDYMDYQVEASISRGAGYEVTLTAGQYIELKGCRLVYDLDLDSDKLQSSN